MPVGYLASVAIVALGFVTAIRPLSRSGRLGRISWFVSAVVNESPFAGFYWLGAVTLLTWVQGDLTGPARWLGAAVAAGGLVSGAVVVGRSLAARPVIERALGEGMGAGAMTGPGRRDRLPWLRIVVAPVPVLAFDLRRRRNLRYGDAGRHHRLDVYRSRTGPAAGPILIHLHGGYFRTGRKSFEGRPLLHRLARYGWLCISANYRLRPQASYGDMLTDAKAVIAWARANAHRYGADPDQVVISGSSAGAHLAVTAALTANRPELQRGFEGADTTVAAAVGLYGYYGPVDVTEPIPTAAGDHAHPHAPPILLAHGTNDTFVAPANPRQLVAQLRGAGARRVVHIELPGAQHSFDLVHSIRFHHLISGIERFADQVMARPDPGCSPPGRPPRRRPVQPTPRAS